MIYYITGSIIFICCVLIGFFYIKFKYKKFIETETLKEEIIKIRAKIKNAQEYFKNTYDHHVFFMIKTNIDLCLEIILNKNLNHQLVYLSKLYEKLYETGYRLKLNYDNPTYIISPLKNFREELAQELIDYIKDITRD
jgi:hypothetical protein